HPLRDARRTDALRRPDPARALAEGPGDRARAAPVRQPRRRRHPGPHRASPPAKGAVRAVPDRGGGRRGALGVSAGRRSLEVPGDAAGMRVDVWLAAALELPRTRVKELLERGAVRIGGRPPRKGDRTVAGARVEVTLPDEDPRPVPQPELPLS